MIKTTLSGFETDFIISEILTIFAKSIPLVGSSKQIIFLFSRIVLATTTLCFCPPDRDMGWSSLNSVKSKVFRTSSTAFSSISFMPSVTWFITLSEKSWWLTSCMTRLLFFTRCFLEYTWLFRSTFTLDLGWTPMSEWTKVLFPMPFLPMIPTIEPSGISRSFKSIPLLLLAKSQWMLSIFIESFGFELLTSASPLTFFSSSFSIDLNPNCSLCS